MLQRKVKILVSYLATVADNSTAVFVNVIFDMANINNLIKITIGLLIFKSNI